MTLPARRGRAGGRAVRRRRRPRRRRAGAARSLAVIGGRGGAGASVFATALAHVAHAMRCWSTSTRGAAASTWCSAARTRPGCGGPTSRCSGGRLGYAALRAGAAGATRRHACCRRAARAARSTPGALGAVIDAGLPWRCHRDLRSAAPSDAGRPRPRSTPPISSSSSRRPTSGRARRRRRSARWLVATNPNVGLVVRGPVARWAARRRTSRASSGCRCWRRCGRSPVSRRMLERGGLRHAAAIAAGVGRAARARGAAAQPARR